MSYLIAPASPAIGILTVVSSRSTVSTVPDGCQSVKS